ncbi:conserved hypothetical protein [Candidatus Desulfarcum epimagneticum]|uniref:DUF2889 domain-containing protein n=1 Tax=uncultured Desulfobacteraceae bacterium TaxID=218296 RepID=A0A484HJS9_9BACT|nr:conserved hypothetical protein [uncultured Desulfobacteraceae bacterium]
MDTKKTSQSPLESEKGTEIHSRHIHVSTFECDGDAVIVEGRLTDRRFVEIKLITGEKSPPAAIHDMIIRLKARVSWPPVILDVEVEMPQIPHEDCLETRKSLVFLKGKTISKGFSAMVQEETRGIKGCRHLSGLLLAMAPAALQGIFTGRAEDGIPKKEVAGLLNTFFSDTCRAWRKDGEVMKRVLKTL